jgi:nucleoside-diphosphate-sugar epimerase
MKVVVLGGAGQIGSALVAHLIELGHTSKSIDILDNSDHDLRCVKRIWTDELHDADFVFFLAFDVGGSQYLAKYERNKQFLDNNLTIMLNVFNELEGSKKPFVFASSQMSNMNFSPYGILKRIGEFYSQSLGGVICKFWNVYGFENSPEKNHVITDFIEMALTLREINMRTSGNEKRQFLFSQDACEALVTLMDNYMNLDKTQIYDITSHEWTSILEIANLIARFTQSKVIPGVQNDLVQQDLLNEPNRNILNLWKPRFNLHEGIRELLKISNVKNKI